MEENSIVKPMTASAPPLLNTTNIAKEGMIRVKHREYLRDISTADVGLGPVWANFRLNPTDRDTFPWLAQIARDFQQWCPHGIVFEFVSTCGNAVSSTNASLGTVSFATQYNTNAEVFEDKKHLLNSFFAVSTKTSENLMHAIECAPEEVPTRLLYTYAELQADGTPTFPGDDRLYDLGYTTVWREGSQQVYTAGELWVTYDISLVKPKLPQLEAAPRITVQQNYKERGNADQTPLLVADEPEEEAKSEVSYVSLSTAHAMALASQRTIMRH